MLTARVIKTVRLLSINFSLNEIFIYFIKVAKDQLKSSKHLYCITGSVYSGFSPLYQNLVHYSISCFQHLVKQTD